jgi:hypothetical protein
VLLLDGAVIVAACEIGGLRVADAHVDALGCTGATLHNSRGPAVAAERLQVSQGVFLRGGFEAVGAGGDGAVLLAGAHIHGMLDCSGATLRNDSGPALNAYEMQVDQGALLVGKFMAISGGIGEHETLNLANVRIGGVLGFAPARLEHTGDPHARLFLDGLIYPGLPRRIAPHDWLRLLREATPWYAAQPYQQLAAAHRAAGHDGEARRVLMAQRRDQIDRKALTGRAERAWARLTGLTLGYGYQPWRALLTLVAVATTAVVLALLLGAHGGVARVDPHPAAATPVFGGGADRRRLGPWPAIDQDGDPGPLRYHRQHQRAGADRCRLGAAVAGVGVCHLVRSGLHRRGPQDLSGSTPQTSHRGERQLGPAGLAALVSPNPDQAQRCSAVMVWSSCSRWARSWPTMVSVCRRKLVGPRSSWTPIRSHKASGVPLMSARLAVRSAVKAASRSPIGGRASLAPRLLVIADQLRMIRWRSPRPSTTGSSPPSASSAW